MNKGQLIEAVAAELGTTKAAASKAIEAVIHSITHGIEADASVTISGFGTFTRKQRAPRRIVNPSTREPMQIEASTTVGFRPSQALKESLNGSG